jgi:hypothetical protein
MSAREMIDEHLWTATADPELARSLLDNYRREVRVEVLAEAAVAIDVPGDTCTCGGCDSCAVRAAAAMLRAMADDAGKDTHPGESTQLAELTAYRAAYEHDITPLETYTLRAAARCHCEDEALAGLARDERNLRWETDPDEPEIEELHVDGQATGYTVTAVTVPSKYDPEAGR